MGVRRNQCIGGCPFNSHCEWGFCECNQGLIKSYVRTIALSRCPVAITPSLRQGSCRQGQGPPRPADFDPFARCSFENNSTCSAIDMNLICNTEISLHGNEVQSGAMLSPLYCESYVQGRCECRRDMRWNSDAGECQVHSGEFSPTDN